MEGEARTALEGENPSPPNTCGLPRGREMAHVASPVQVQSVLESHPWLAMPGL